MKPIRATLALLVAVAALAAPAYAGLGGDVASVQADLASVKGALRLSSSEGFTVHEVTTSYGAVVREYVSAADRVFAVSWRGPGRPDLHQLLGSYYEQFAQAAAASSQHNHHQLLIEQPGLVVQSSGHMRAYFGRAWAPDLMPKNFSVNSIN